MTDFRAIAASPEAEPIHSAQNSGDTHPETTATSSKELLAFSETEFLISYLPPSTGSSEQDTTPQSGSTSTKPHVTLTYAVSLDSELAIAPGQRTNLSGPESKAMTHYLRSQHDAILIGVGTAVADDPSLNCRLDPASYSDSGREVPQPRPVVLDPHGRWDFTSESKVLQAVKEGRGKAPWIVLSQGPVSSEKRTTLEDAGGEYLFMSLAQNEGIISWSEILQTLAEKGMRSVMVEGGGKVVNDLLSSKNIHLVDSVIITIAPTYLGRGGVLVSPENTRDGERWVPSVRFTDVKWKPLGQDVVMCGRIPNLTENG